MTARALAVAVVIIAAIVAYALDRSPHVEERDVRVAFYSARAAAVAESLTTAQAALSDSVARISAARLRASTAATQTAAE